MASILPALGLLGPHPLALVEVGASAGLCLYPDRWRFDYGGGLESGPQTAPRIRCELVMSRISTPLPLPEAPLEVVWRAGIDLNPLDVTSEDDVRWLECLIWPEQDERFDRLRQAVAMARSDPPRLMRADLRTQLESVAREAPSGAHLVVFHSATLAYAAEEDRARFVRTIQGIADARWISNEGPGVFPQLAIGTPMTGRDGTPAVVDARMFADDDIWSGIHGNMFLTMLDGRPVAWSDPHGAKIEWIG